MKTVEININRLMHQLAIYGLSKVDFLARVSEGLKKKLSESEVFASEIKITTLKRIDSLFDKGLSYYIDPKDPVVREGESIFF